MPKVTPKTDKKSVSYKTLGFGVPASSDPHHFKVIVPKSNNRAVEINEHLGMQAQSEESSVIERVMIERRRWTAIRAEVQRAFNVRLKSYGLTTSSWKVGENLVDRLLGKELCVLAWAIESIDIENIPVAVRNWLALRPEERWWLFGMTAVSSGTREERDVGWRIALKHALGDIVQSEVHEPSPSYDKKSLVSENTQKEVLQSGYSNTDDRCNLESSAPEQFTASTENEHSGQQDSQSVYTRLASEDALFLFEAKQARAAGHPLGDMAKPEFVVNKGSTANIPQAKSLRPAIRELRKRLVEEGILVEDGDVYSFTQEYTFKSPSAAACVIAGNPRSGMDAWRDMKGRSLKELGYGKSR